MNLEKQDDYLVTAKICMKGDDAHPVAAHPPPTDSVAATSEALGAISRGWVPLYPTGFGRCRPGVVPGVCRHTLTRLPMVATKDIKNCSPPLIALFRIKRVASPHRRKMLQGFKKGSLRLDGSSVVFVDILRHDRILSPKLFICGTIYSVGNLT